MCGRDNLFEEYRRHCRPRWLPPVSSLRPAELFHERDDRRSPVDREADQSVLRRTRQNRCEQLHCFCCSTQSSKACDKQPLGFEDSAVPAAALQAIDPFAGPFVREFALLQGRTGHQAPDRGVFVDLRGDFVDAVDGPASLRVFDRRSQLIWDNQAESDPFVVYGCSQPRQGHSVRDVGAFRQKLFCRRMIPPQRLDARTDRVAW